MTKKKGSEAQGDSRESAADRAGHRPHRIARLGRNRADHPPGEEACRLLADHASKGLMILQDGRVVYCNQAAAKILDRQPVHEFPDTSVEVDRAGLRSIFESSPNAILITDLQGNIQSCNLAATEILGCPRDQIVGRNLLAFISTTDHP